MGMGGRADIIEACNEFLKTMTPLGFLQPSNTPNEETARLLLEVPVFPDCDNTICWFHDETHYEHVQLLASLCSAD